MEPLFPPTGPERALQTFDGTRFFRRVLYVVVAAGVGVASVAGSIDWERFEPSAAVLLPLAWAVVRAGAGWYKAEFSANPQHWFWRLVCVALLAGVGVGVAGCASSHQTLRTADGDEYRRRGISLLSKQEAEGRASLVAYPNGSGLEFQIGDRAQQDAESLVPLVAAVVQMLATQGRGLPISHGAGPPSSHEAPGPSALTRLNAALTEIAELRALLSATPGGG